MLKSPKKIKVCFVCPYVYPLFNTEIRTMFGGFEVRISQIVRELVRRGNFEISIIVADHGQPHFENRDGIEFISWIGKGFWGITRATQGKASTGTVQDVVRVETLRLSDEDRINQDADIGMQSTSETPQEYCAPDDLEQNGTAPRAEAGSTSLFESPKRPAESLRNRLKIIYKRIIPWSVRVVITGTAAGSLNLLAHVKNGVIGFLRHIKWGLQDLFAQSKRGTIEFIEYVRKPLAVVRSAMGDIADVPVYYKDVSIYDEANADIYIVPGNGSISAHVAFYCKKRNKRYIMLAGSDIDFSLEFMLNPEGRDLYQEPYSFKRYAIENANMHIVQNEQQCFLAKRYGASPILIRNPVNLERMFPKVANPNIILWVGNTDERVKRPSLLLKAARSFPEYPFIMIATPATEEDYRRLQEQCNELPNMLLTSRIPFNEVERYFAQAKLFINTSTLEGFPNTFLQAGKYGVPIISLKVDPNDMISRDGCGLVCNDDFSLMKDNIQRLMSDADLYAETSRHIQEYVRRNHDKEIIIPQYEQAFKAVLAFKKTGQ